MPQPHVDGDLPDVPVVGPGGVLPPSVVVGDLPRQKADVVRKLAQWAETQELPAISDDELIKFVHSCDYDLDTAKSCVKGFFSSRNQSPELFSNWDTSLPNLQSIFDVIMVAIMPRRTPDNYRVIVNSLQTSHTKHYVFADVCKALLMMMETIFLTEPTVGGVVFVHDMSKASFSHFLKFGWSLPKKLTTYTQEGVPLKQQTVHLVNCSGFVDKGLKLLSHLGRKEDWDRLRVHRGDDYSELHNYIPLDCLPRELGGSLPSLLELHEITVRRLGAFKEVFQTQLTQTRH